MGEFRVRVRVIFRVMLSVRVNQSEALLSPPTYEKKDLLPAIRIVSLAAEARMHPVWAELHATL